MHQLIEKGVHDLCKKVAEIRLQENMIVSGEANVLAVECATQAKGFKHRPGTQSKNRMYLFVIYDVIV